MKVALGVAAGVLAGAATVGAKVRFGNHQETAQRCSEWHRCVACTAH